MPNLDECKSVKTHFVALYVNGDNKTYLERFGAERNSKEIEK